MVTAEVRFRSRFNLQGRVERARGLSNAVVMTLDPFSIDASAELVRGTDAAFIAWLRTTVDGLGVAGATGTLTMRRAGCELDDSPFDVAADAILGIGFMSVVIPGEAIQKRGYYTWIFIAEAPGGGQARAEGRFRFE